MSEVPAVQQLSPREFENFRRLAYDYCGLNIESGKEGLVASRLAKIMRNRNITSFSQYYDYVVADKTSGALIEMIDHLTTNHTSFFREPQHFDFLCSEILPRLATRSTIKFWSAACSSGEEPYTLAFAVAEYFNEELPGIEILATDISTRILDRARKSIYEGDRFRSMSLEMQRRYLLKGTGSAQGMCLVKPEIQAMVRFERVNLMESFPGFVEQYPLILCRNVMIYFDAMTQQRLVRRLFHQLEPGGYLFIGHSESFNGIEHPFEYVRPAIYRRPGALSATEGELHEEAHSCADRG